MGIGLVRYRTYIRVYFDEEVQRSKPAACWQLWKESRGLNEAKQRGDMLLAVEYVGPLQGSLVRNNRIQLENTSFDGFCITWTTNPAISTSDCLIPVRFNFLSIDFTRSKGVKGISVRLCAKTEVSAENKVEDADRESEMCYCKVQLFRDHGAERKTSNNVALVKKKIGKLKQQIAQTGMYGGSGKRKHGNASTTVEKLVHHPMKVAKHKRTCSSGSQVGPPFCERPRFARRQTG